VCRLALLSGVTSSETEYQIHNGGNKMLKVQSYYQKSKSMFVSKISGLLSLKDVFIDGVMTFLLSLISMFSSATPFGVAFFAATFSHYGWFVKVGAVTFGAFFALGIAAGIKYLFSLIIFTFSVVMLSASKPLLRAAFMSASLFLVNVIILLTKDILLYDFFVAVCESFMCFVSVLIIEKAYPVTRHPSMVRSSTANELVCVAALLSLFLMPLAKVPEFFSISLINVLSLIICLSFAYKTDIGKSASTGVVLGALTGISQGNVSMMMGIYAFSSMCASAFNRFGKAAVTLGFILSASFMSVFVGGTIDYLIDLYEIVISATLFMLIPGRLLDYIGFLNEKSISGSDTAYLKFEQIVSEKIRKLSESLRYLSKKFISFNRSSNPYTKKEMINLFDECCAVVCANCGMKYNCWQNSYKKTYASMFDMMEICDNDGELRHSNMPYDFRKSCVKTEEFIYEFNNMYKNYKSEKLWRMRIMESKNIAVTHLDCVAEVVNNICEEINVSVDTDAEEEIYSKLTKMGYTLSYVWVLVKNDDQFEIDVSLVSYKKDDEKKICSIVSDVIKKPLRVAGVNENSRSKVVTLLPRENYSVSVGVCQAVRDGEELCGDAYASVCMTEGGHFVAICDGMGSGKDAHNESVAVIELLKQLVGAGFTLDSALNLINSSLVLRNRQEMYSTLDVCIFDLKSGAVSFRKAGGAQSIICSDEVCETIRTDTLPVGIKISDGVGVFSRSLKSGGLVVMMSDGVADVDENTHWIETVCKERKRNNPQTIAKVIMDTAIKKSNGECRDDMTVIVAKVSSNV